MPVAEIRRLCLRALPRPKVPSYIEVLERAPLNESMKLDREGLVRRAEEGSAAAGGLSGPGAVGSLEEHALGSRLAVDQERMSP